jgi:hypothetical protein
MAEHKHAALLRMAADNADQLFECKAIGIRDIITVLLYPSSDWRPVKQTKKIKRWLWADKYGDMTDSLYSENELHEESRFKTKLLWSETEFEVDDE